MCGNSKLNQVASATSGIVVKSFIQICVDRLKPEHVGCAVLVRGRVVAVNNPRPTLSCAAFQCSRRAKIQEIPQDYVTKNYKKPSICTNGECSENGEFLLRPPPESQYIDFQELVIESICDDARIGVYLTAALCRDRLKFYNKEIVVRGVVVGDQPYIVNADGWATVKTEVDHATK